MVLKFFIMAVAQGRGGEQFGFSDLEGNSFVDWRFFYTSNLSVKKNLVNNWSVEGFSLKFSELNYEDIEFAYRLHSKNKLRIFYSSIPTGLHFQSMTVTEFCMRQRRAGRMAVKFIEIQPTIKKFLLPNVYIGGDTLDTSVILRMIDGMQAYVEWLELKGDLGTESWHTDLLHTLFAVYFRLGITDELDQGDDSFYASHMNTLINQSLSDLSRNIGYTVFGQKVNFGLKKVGRHTKVEYRVFNLPIRISSREINRILSNKFLFKIYCALKQVFKIRRS